MSVSRREQRDDARAEHAVSVRDDHCQLSPAVPHAPDHSALSACFSPLPGTPSTTRRDGVRQPEIQWLRYGVTRTIHRKCYSSPLLFISDVSEVHLSVGSTVEGDIGAQIPADSPEVDFTTFIAFSAGSFRQVSCRWEHASLGWAATRSAASRERVRSPHGRCRADDPARPHRGGRVGRARCRARAGRPPDRGVPRRVRVDRDRHGARLAARARARPARTGASARSLLAPIVGILTVLGFQAGFMSFKDGAVSVVAPIIACEGGVAAVFSLLGGEQVERPRPARPAARCRGRRARLARRGGGQQRRRRARCSRGADLGRCARALGSGRSRSRRRLGVPARARERRRS